MDRRGNGGDDDEGAPLEWKNRQGRLLGAIGMFVSCIHGDRVMVDGGGSKKGGGR